MDTASSAAAPVLDLASLSPREIDERWAPYVAASSAAWSNLNETLRSLARYRKFGKVPGYLERRREAQQAAVDAARSAEEPFRAEWERRGGWNRYVQCLTDGGHVHRSRPHCHTLTPGRSLVALLPELTGLSEGEMVARMGFAACTHCFPWAPTVPSFRAGQEEAAAAVAAKKADRCAGAGLVAKSFRGTRYGVCSGCGSLLGVSSHGIVRPHKARQAAGKGGA